MHAYQIAPSCYEHVVSICRAGCAKTGRLTCSVERIQWLYKLPLLHLPYKDYGRLKNVHLSESLCKFDTGRLFFRESICKFFSFSSQHFFFVFVVVFGWKAWNEYNQWKERKKETLKFMRRFCAQHHSTFDYSD